MSVALSIVNELVSYIDINTNETRNICTNNKIPMLIWVTGRSGCGKTTLCENLKKSNNFIHFECDQWCNGGDPVLDSGKTVNQEYSSFKNRSKELVDAFDNKWTKPELS
eukprot:428475_1